MTRSDPRSGQERTWLLPVGLLLAALVLAAGLHVVLAAQPARAQSGGEVPDADCPGPSDTFTFPFSPQTARIAQSFTAENSGRLTGAQVVVQKSAGSTGDYVLEIREVGTTGAPTDVILPATTVNDATVPVGTSTITGNFVPGATVVAGQRYALAVRRPGSTNLGVGVRTGDDCPDGRLFNSNTGTAPFAEIEGIDLVFATFVTPEDNSPPDEQGCDIRGTRGDDTLTGTSADETICGMGGDDKITGGGGDDELRGNSGSDTLDSRDGARDNDVLVGGDGKDRCRADKRDEKRSC